MLLAVQRARQITVYPLVIAHTQPDELGLNLVVGGFRHVKILGFETHLTGFTQRVLPELRKVLRHISECANLLG